MIKKHCETCEKKGDCKKLCEEIEALIEKEIKPMRWGTYSYDVIYTNEKGEERTGPDLFRKIDPGKQFAADADNDLNIEWDTLSPDDATKEILDPKMYDKIRELANICDKKNRSTKIKTGMFFAFLRCDSVKMIAERAGCTEENIRKYLVRMFDCIVKRLYKKTGFRDEAGEAVLTPKGYKEKWLYER